jgi:peptidoglycan-N-acetylglucosamine deacetylase
MTGLAKPFLALAMLTLSALALSVAWAASGPCLFPDVIGTHRVLAVETEGGPRFGKLQYRHTLPLGEREVVLTFDDGPSRSATARILEVLGQHCVKATFFQVGIWARHRRAIARQVADAGHTLATHSWSHPKDLSLLDLAAARLEVDKGFEGVSNAVGRPIARFLRYPGLHDSHLLNRYAQARDYAVFSCDVATDDWRGIDARSIVERTLTNLRRAGDRGIILFHDTKVATAEALPMLFKRLHEGGYRIVHMEATQGYRAGERQRLTEAN